MVSFYFIFIQLLSHEDDVKTLTKWQNRDSQMNLVKLPNQLRMFSILPVSKILQEIIQK